MPSSTTSYREASIPTLPTELWSMILHFFLGSSIGVHEPCNHFTFPEIILHLGSPRRYPPVLHKRLGSLRLVCRTFNTLIGSPYFFMKDSSSAIPSSTRALFICSRKEVDGCLHRLLTKSPASHRIVVLDIPGFDRFETHGILPFYTLCKNARSLAAIRSLTIRPGLVSGSRLPSNFWHLLDEAFPQLTFLSLQGPKGEPPKDKLVTFANLEVLNLDRIEIPSWVQFPSLRHVALTAMPPPWWLSVGSALCESLIVQKSDKMPGYEWDLLPRLRLLGVPASSLSFLPVPPPNHPFCHLYIYVDTRWRKERANDPAQHKSQVAWLKLITKRFPNVARFSLEFRLDAHVKNGWANGYFSPHDFEPLGFTFKSHFAGKRQGVDRIILERKQVGS